MPLDTVLLKRILLNGIAVLIGVILVTSPGRTAVIDHFPLVEDAVGRAVVIIPDDSWPIATYAAEELIEHVALRTGVSLPLINESDLLEDSKDQVYRIFIGSTRHAQWAGIDVSGLKPEEAVIRISKTDLFIAGEDGPGDPLDGGHAWSGTLWGVYDFLDRELGVRWLWPGELGTFVPRSNNLVVPSGERIVERRFQWQRVRQTTNRGRWQNNPLIGFTEEGLKSYIEAENIFLRRHGMSFSRKPSFGHSFGGWWPQYGEEHPEWFQKVDGVRGPTPGQNENRVSMCVTSLSLHNKIIEDWIKELENSDKTPALRLAEADGRAHCECERCLAWDGPQVTEEELANMTRSMQRSYTRPRNASDRYARFWKLMHERAEKIAPDVVTTAYVYLNYFVEPSDHITFSSNVHLDYVPWTGYWFPRRIQEQEWLKEQWMGWQKTGASVSYRPNYFHDGYIMPHVFARQFAEKFQFVEQNGAVGTDFDALKGHWGTQGTTLYLLMRLHNRPEARVDDLLREYYNAFGEAADMVNAYFDYWEAHVTRNRHNFDVGQAELGASRLRAYAKFAHQFFPPEVFSEAEAILDDARSAVKEHPDSEYARRVEFLQLGLDHARKAAVLGALFADKYSSREQREAAYRNLVDFRRKTEGWFYSNLVDAAYIETSSWNNEPGFIGK